MCLPLCQFHSHVCGEVFKLANIIRSHIQSMTYHYSQRASQIRCNSLNQGSITPWQHTISPWSMFTLLLTVLIRCVCLSEKVRGRGKYWLKNWMFDHGNVTNLLFYSWTLYWTPIPEQRMLRLQYHNQTVYTLNFSQC